MFRQLLAAVCFAASVAALGAQSPGRFNVRLLGFTHDLRFDEAYAHDPLAEDAASPVETPIKGYLNHEFSVLEVKSRDVIFSKGKDRAAMNTKGELIAKAKLPEKTSSALLVFLPANPDSKSLSQVMAIDDSKRAFPGGSLHITNLSRFPIKLMLEKKQFDFKPGGTTVIEKPPLRAGNMTGMRAFAFMDKKWVPLSTGLWPYSEKSRSVKIFYQDPVTGKVQLRSFDDVPPRDPKTASTP